MWRVHVEDCHGITWAKNFLAGFDTSKLEWISINPGSNGLGLYGRCFYPSKGRKLYRISCQVPGPFPHQIHIRKRPVYKREDGTWPEIPEGCQRAGWYKNFKTGKEWERVIGWTTVQDINEAVVWIVSHECFHFLRKTRQIPGRNTEIDADEYANLKLKEYLDEHNEYRKEVD